MGSDLNKLNAIFKERADPEQDFATDLELIFELLEEMKSGLQSRISVNKNEREKLTDKDFQFAVNLEESAKCLEQSRANHGQNFPLTFTPNFRRRAQVCFSRMTNGPSSVSLSLSLPLAALFFLYGPFPSSIVDSSPLPEKWRQGLAAKCFEVTLSGATVN